MKGDKANFSSDNQYYIERNSSASQGLPLSMMSFNNFGGDQMDDSDASISYIIQTADKQVIKVQLEDGDNAFFSDDILFSTS